MNIELPGLRLVIIIAINLILKICFWRKCDGFELNVQFNLFELAVPANFVS